MSKLASALASHQFMGQSVPSYMQDGLLDYLEYGIPPGGFLTAILENDLFQTYARADQINCLTVGAYVSFLYNHADGRSYGSREKVQQWVDSKRRLRQSMSKSATGETSHGKHQDEQGKQEQSPDGD